MANASVHNLLSLINDCFLLEHTIRGSKALLEMVKRNTHTNHLPSHLTKELSGYLMISEGLLEQAISCASNYQHTLRQYHLTLNSNST